MSQGCVADQQDKVQQGKTAEIPVSMGRIRREDREHITVGLRKVAGNPGLQFESVSNGVIRPSLLKAAGILAYGGY